MEELCISGSEINASIIKGFLENNGIKSSFGPNGRSFLAAGSPSLQTQTIFVEKGKVEEALILLKNQDLLTE